MNNLAMSNIAAVPTNTTILNAFPVEATKGGYKKKYSVDTAWRADYFVYWNAAENCAYIMTNLPGWQGSVANIYKRYGYIPTGLGAENGPLGLPTSNFFGDAWGVSWQRFTNGYITNQSTGYGDMTFRTYYVGGTANEDRALAAVYSNWFDYLGSSGINSFPLTQDPQCTNSTFPLSCGAGKTGRFTKAIGPYGYVQTFLARTGHDIAYGVGGEIANKWRATYGATQPWNGALGFPKSEEFVNGGVTQQNFENGYMTWTGVATMYTPVKCSDTCQASAAGTSCWNTTTGTSMTCGSAMCSAICNWASEASDYCYDGTEGNTHSTCGLYGVTKQDSDCLRDPTHAGCNPLNQDTGYNRNAICNDGTTVPVVSNVATRSWTSLTGPRIAPQLMAAASSVEVGGYAASYAVDASTSTRWSSVAGIDPQWLRVDLGASYPISGVSLNWETAYAASYKIQTSNDAVSWTDVVNVSTGDGGIDQWNFTATARYVRMLGLTRATQWGYSLWDFKVALNTEQSRINTLMNNAAQLIGCQASIDTWPTADISVDPSGQDLTKAAYAKAYGASQDCGWVYFNRALGCAFPLAMKDGQPGYPFVTTDPQIFTVWNANKEAFGLPTSLPSRGSDIDVSWQRFQNAYVTRSYPQSALYVGGNMGTAGEARALASKFGQQFDHYSAFSPYRSLQAPPLNTSTTCVNPTLPYDSCTPSTFGLKATSATGSYWIPFHTKKAVAVFGAIRDKYYANAPYEWQYAHNPTLMKWGLGWPVSDAKFTGSTTSQQFLNGKIVSAPGSSARIVAGNMDAVYDAFGGAAGPLGYPLEDTTSPADVAIARTQRFSGGTLSIDASGLSAVVGPPPPVGAWISGLAVRLDDNNANGLPVRISWIAGAGTTRTKLYRQVNGPNWVLIDDNLSPPIEPAESVYLDAAAPLDSYVCYQIIAEPGPITSAQMCVVTRDARNIGVRLPEIRVKVANRTDAETDDGLIVKLRRTGRPTWIESSRDDFERGSDVIYPIIPDKDLKYASDIEEITLRVPGEDAICISGIELYVDRPSQPTGSSYVAFRKDFGDANCKWLENDKVLTIPFVELRASPDWQALTPPFFAGIDRARLHAVVEAVAGNWMLQKNLNFQTEVQTEFSRIANPNPDPDPTVTGDEISDIDIRVRLYGTGNNWFTDLVDLDVQAEPRIEPQYSCDANAVRVNNTVIVNEDWWINQGFEVPLIGDLVNLVWWPLYSVNFVTVVGNMLVPDRHVGLAKPPTPDLHYCSPLSGPYVDGIGACSNIDKAFPYKRACQ